jgi:hypothetical protein
MQRCALKAEAIKYRLADASALCFILEKGFGMGFVLALNNARNSGQTKPQGREALKSCDQNIQRTILLTQEMIRLADKGDAEREDVGCGILYGILRDSAYKLWRMAEEEKKRHQAKGWWQVPCVLDEVAPDKPNDVTPIFDKPEKED